VARTSEGKPGAHDVWRNDNQTAPLPSPGNQSLTHAPGGPLRRRKRIILAAALVALIAAVGGLIAAATIKSPAEVAAEAGPPPPTVLTTSVTRQIVSSTVLAQGVVSESSEISGPDSFGNAGGAAAGGDTGAATLPIVTRIFRGPGSLVVGGDVLAEVAGRPLFVFRGSVPVYRDLAPGESGTDVAQLQQGLASAGFGTGSDMLGTYGPGTAAAVAAFYQAIGYSAVMTTGKTRAGRGAMVPDTEIMFIPRLPAHVVSYSNSVGQEVSGPLMTLSMGEPKISGQINPTYQGLVRRGTQVEISGGLATGNSYRGTVDSISGTVKSQGSISGGDYLPAQISPAVGLPVSSIGQDVQITITSARSNGEVLAVPEAAVFAAASGTTYVTRVTAHGGQVRVPVRIGVTGNGMVQITPVGGAALSAGDRVVTGENYARSAGGSSGGGVG
jgi:hypothetical protein